MRGRRGGAETGPLEIVKVRNDFINIASQPKPNSRLVSLVANFQTLL